MFSLTRRGNKLAKVVFCEEQGRVITPERRAEDLLERTRTWVLTHQ